MLKDNIKSMRKSKGLSQEELDTPVSTLLGENIDEKKQDDLKVIAEKLEVINLQLSQRQESKRKTIHWIFIILCFLILLTFIILGTWVGNSYLEWDYNDPELAVLGVLTHSFVWIFVRIAPLIFIGSIIGIFLTRKKK